LFHGKLKSDLECTGSKYNVVLDAVNTCLLLYLFAFDIIFTILHGKEGNNDSDEFAFKNYIIEQARR
jgi:hypothetical protein